jgi:hypothetical protein
VNTIGTGAAIRMIRTISIAATTIVVIEARITNGTAARLQL